MRLSTWTNLLADHHAALRAAADDADPHDAAAITRLRKLGGGDADLARAALQLAQARRGAVAKFGDRASTLVADPEGVQQASSMAVAAHKAGRFRATLGESARVLDLCCGIGGDAVALRAAGLRVAAIDHDPCRAWMAARNAAVPVACADVTRLGLGSQPAWAYHIDPARRTEAGRVFRLADYLPPPAFLRDLTAAVPTGAIKLGPGVDLADAEEQLPQGEFEFISEAGRLVQAVLWTGDLAGVRRTATRIDPASGVVMLRGEPMRPPVGPLQRYLYAVDPAVERADLLGVLCEDLAAPMIHPALGLLTSDGRLSSPWLTRFELLAEMPWRLPSVKAWLAEHDAGIVEVKTRGKAVDPDQVQRQLRGRGATPFTVFVLRWDERKVALVTRRLAV